MLFTLATILWIIVLILSISKHIKNKKTNNNPISQQSPLNLKGVNDNYSFIIEYLKCNGGKAKYSNVKQEILSFTNVYMDTIINNMVQQNLINHSIDTNSNEMEEYIELKQGVDENEWE